MKIRNIITGATAAFLALGVVGCASSQPIQETAPDAMPQAVSSPIAPTATRPPPTPTLKPTLPPAPTATRPLPTPTLRPFTVLEYMDVVDCVDAPGRHLVCIQDAMTTAYGLAIYDGTMPLSPCVVSATFGLYLIAKRQEAGLLPDDSDFYVHYAIVSNQLETLMCDADKALEEAYSFSQ